METNSQIKCTKCSSLNLELTHYVGDRNNLTAPRNNPVYTCLNCKKNGICTFIKLVK